MDWINVWIIFATLFSVVSFFPLVNSSHWIFRVFDFLRLQILALLILTLCIGFAFFPLVHSSSWIFYFALLAAIGYQIRVILPYLPRISSQRHHPDGITILSVNVMQKNSSYEKLLELIKEINPCIVLTMETNKSWERALSSLEKHYDHSVKVPKENRYGMHFYSKLELTDSKVHHLISSEHPSIEAHLKDSQGNDFVFWGIHPPPPSPTEKPTARQKDGELMKLAAFVRQSAVPVVVCGDFNNVCWSQSSKQFGRISRMKDARINKGIYATFPAKNRLFRIPIDLFFHSKGVEILNLKVLDPIGSDHLPLLAEIHVVHSEKPNPELKAEQKAVVSEKVEDGKAAAMEENGN